MKLDKIRFFGRHINNAGREYFAYSGSGFEFVILPQIASCSLTLVLTSELREHDSQYVGVFINDVFHSKERLISGLNRIHVQLDDAPNNVIVKIIKYNEAYLSSIYLEDIELENALMGELPPVEKKATIGFFGDSLTCGYGLIDYKGTRFQMETEEFDKSYAFLTAKELNMNYVVTARSGISIGIKIWMDKLFNEIYDTVDMIEKCPAVHNLDYAVINLGTNDQAAYYRPSIDKENAIKKFKDEYHKLIDRIILDNPNVKIVICYNMILLTDVFQHAIEEQKHYIESHYSNQYRLVKCVPNNEGAGGHPYFTAHKDASKLLVKAIKSFG